MITKTNDDIMQEAYHVEVTTMPYFPCAECGKELEINIGGVSDWNKPNVASPVKLVGSATCRHCNTGITSFEIFNNMISYVSGKSVYGSIDGNLPQVAKTLFGEAELCFKGGSSDGAAAMCRACTEATLDQAKFKGSNLKEKIDKAHKTQANPTGILDDEEFSLAHGSRLITNKALHEGELIDFKDIPSMISATVRIVNKLATILTNP